MRLVAILCCCAMASAAYALRIEAPQPSAIVLADETVWFDAEMRPQFSANQIHHSAAGTRSGLARWAATPHGRALIARLDNREFLVDISEDELEEGAGRAPQPSLATLAAAGDHALVKIFRVIVNPTYGMAAIALAGEMLHVDFYARGISLPHHERVDFQREWREVAAELGMPAVEHGLDDVVRRRSARLHW